MDIIPQLILNAVIAGAIYALVTLGFNRRESAIPQIEESRRTVDEIERGLLFIFMESC